ncbi:hypothetical protein ACXR0O_00985 [Verrucomicrobiota bacterium sgz303538]
MKVLFAVLSLSFLLLGCEQKKVVTTDEEYTDGEPALVGVPPKDQAKNVRVQTTPPPKPGNWMWDKGRGNPLEQRPR